MVIVYDDILRNLYLVFKELHKSIENAIKEEKVKKTYGCAFIRM